MKRYVVIVTAVALSLFAFGSPAVAGPRNSVGPPGKSIHSPSKEIAQRAPIPNVRPHQKIGPRHTIVPPRYRASR